MKRFVGQFLLFCGIAFGLAAFPVFAQPSGEAEINRKPFRDFAQTAARKLQNGEINFDQTFTVELEGALTKEGRFDVSRTRFVKTDGDEKIVEVVKNGVEAIGETGWLIVLRNLGFEQIKATVLQDNERFTAVIASDERTPERAKTLSSGLNQMVSVVLMMDKNNSRKLRDDERKLLGGVRVTAEEKSVKINFSISKAELREMIERKIAGIGN